MRIIEIESGPHYCEAGFPEPAKMTLLAQCDECGRWWFSDISMSRYWPPYQWYRVRFYHRTLRRFIRNITERDQNANRNSSSSAV